MYRYQGVGHVSVVRVAERGPFVALVVLVALMVFLPSRVWTVMLVGLGLGIGLSLGWAVSGARGVRFSRRPLHAWVQVGDLLEEAFSLQNDSPLPTLAAEVEDHSDLPGYEVSTVRAVGHHTQYSWRKTGTSQRRGLFRLGPTTVRFGDPLGIFVVTCEYPDTREMLVFPPVLHNLSVIAPSGGGQGVAASRQRSLAETAAIGGLRDYLPGDPIRRVHWPLSIRHRTFLVKEFDRETGSNTWLALDLDRAVHKGEGEESTLEYSIIWAASWAWHLLREGKGVGLYTYGPERIIIPPTGGAKQLWRILRVLAPVEAQAKTPLSALLREVRPRLMPGDSLVVITPSAAPDWPVALVRPGLRAAAKVVVLLDAPSFRESSGSKAETDSSVAGMRALLASLGVEVHLVQHQEGLHARPAAPGGGDWEYIVTTWGKVVVRSRPADVKP